MTVLPIVQRELRVAARRRETYWGRVVVAVLALCLFVWMMLILLPQTQVTPAHYGVFLFRGLLVVATLYCAIGSAATTADCLSREKREGTLGLLFLTDLKGYDIVLGKLVATSVNTVYASMAVIPVLALSIQLGGVSYQEVAYAVVLLLNTLFLSLATGIFVSTLSRHERRAMFAALFCLFFATMLPLIAAYLLAAMGFGELLGIPMAAFSPAYPLGFLLVSSHPTLALPDWSFWQSIACEHALSWVLLVLSTVLLPGVWRARESLNTVGRTQEKVEQWAFGLGLRRVALRRRLLKINPFLWLMHRECGKPWYVWFYFVAVMTTWMWGNYHYGDVLFDIKSGIPGLLLIQAFLKIWVVSESCTRLAEDRRLGALELLLSTPLSERDIVRGHWLALRRQFAKPLLAFFVFEFLILRHIFSTGIAVASIASLVFDLVAVGWVGMWTALRGRGTNRAILATIGWVLLLPWGLFAGWLYLAGTVHRLLGVHIATGFTYDFWVWFTCGILVDAVVGLGWARPQVLRHFRLSTTEAPPRRGWFRTRPQAPLTAGLTES